MGFDEILADLKSSYVPFNKKVERSRKPKNFEKSIEKSKKKESKPVISEIKFSSPTGMKSHHKKPVEVAREMISGGAFALSVLTEEKYFNGSLENLKEISGVVETPLLRKDFIFHKAQIPESYYYGADSLLLISSFFTLPKLKGLIEESRRFGMEPVVEVHTGTDIELAEEAGAKIYLINNRDKDTLKIDLERTERMAPSINGLKISASGISSPKDLKYVLEYTDAALIGTSIMTSRDIRKGVEELVYG